MDARSLSANTGAMLSEVPKEGEGLKIIGSAMMAHAASKEEVMEMIKKDIYADSGVWNLEKVRSRTALRLKAC
jgi:uncharacterized protein